MLHLCLKCFSIKNLSLQYLLIYSLSLIIAERLYCFYPTRIPNASTSATIWKQGKGCHHLNALEYFLFNQFGMLD